MSEPTVTITKAEYDALQKVAEVWDEHCQVWKKALSGLEVHGAVVTAERFEDAINAMDEAVAEAVKKEAKP